MMQRTLEGWTIAVSISDSPDLGPLGLGPRHLQDMMLEVARHLMAAGATLLYGGDLRRNGYTELLAEVAARHHTIAEGRRPAFVNMLPWPVHMSWNAEQLERAKQAFASHATLERLDSDGKTLLDIGPVATHGKLDDKIWVSSLTAMRERMAEECSARIVLGGQVSDYKGSMPGIAEEVLLTLARGRPTFVLGGYGGCAADICEEIGILQPKRPRRQWEKRDLFYRTPWDKYGTELTFEEAQRLASTVHTDEAVALILRGLQRSAMPG